MDLNSIIPLLLNNSKSQTKTESENDSHASTNDSVNSMLLTSLISGKSDQTALINAIAKNSGNPQLSQALNLANNIKNTQKKVNPSGFKAIKPFVNNDIMGKLTKYFN
ncbi:MAG: hypothetical protein LBU60_01165 [Clostridiales bacterium]|jgi:hypothetical protein|nr:hypothetical protein [Clostridiales bacterium]